MINFMLEYNGQITSCPDGDFSVLQKIKCLDFDSCGTYYVTLMLLTYGKAAFTAMQIGFLHRRGDDLRIDEHEFVMYRVIIIVNIITDDSSHLLWNTKLYLPGSSNVGFVEFKQV